MSSIVGYATFYFVRKNLSIAMPAMESGLGIQKTQLGLFLTMHGLLYGVSKFANGFLGDRANARVLMVSGLAISAILNVLFGFSSTVIALGLIWTLNGWFQGMGFPPCARLLTNWFSPRQLATKMSIWNMSHPIGGGLIVIMCGYLVGINWRLCFFVPAVIALACAAFLWATLPDTPPSVGLPEVAGTSLSPANERVPDALERDCDVTPNKDSSREFRAFVYEHVFRNKYIWIVSFANFFVYIIRYAVLDWGPTLLTQSKHIRITHAGWMVGGFEFCGLLGALIGGWLTDRWFGGRAVRVCLIYMILAGVSVFLFWKIPGQSELGTATLLGAAGFFIYGPQCLLAVAAANLATKKAAATAIGLTSIFGYASTVLSGWGLGALAQHYGWNDVFAGLIVVAVLGSLLFALAWNAKAHGYGR
ncbi:MAG TPA: MFS transporter [Pyrinomonadaceae bacterium]|jgi:OPA family glycerol-3-phosphate transporter-like MFS transporter/OPA family sugar phosphate sensor protein UhpC-like MFS transporter|nr:MFS transporter [Pyrinomonadaceae bacterium]